jgi:hypothetical protein
MNDSGTSSGTSGRGSWKSGSRRWNFFAGDLNDGNVFRFDGHSVVSNAQDATFVSLELFSLFFCEKPSVEFPWFFFGHIGSLVDGILHAVGGDEEIRVGTETLRVETDGVAVATEALIRVTVCSPPSERTEDFKVTDARIADANTIDFKGGHRFYFHEWIRAQSYSGWALIHFCK